MTSKLAEIRTRIGKVQAFATDEEEGQERQYRLQVIPVNELTEDGRIFENLTWREPPLPLMATKTNSMGHEGAVLVGNMSSLALEDGWVVAEVRWDTEDETSMEFKRLVDEGFLTSVSADVALLDYDIEVVYDEDGFVEDMTLVVHEGKILGATIVPMPAFEDAGFTASADDDLRPPAEWFLDPQLEHLTPLRIDGDRLYGHLAPWNECHIGITNACVTAPRNETDYSLFLAGEIEAADGSMIPVGQITLSGGHADRGLNARASAKHYDDTRSAVADVAVGEDEHGIWIAGAVRPGVTLQERRMLTASKLSGDWRPFKGELELVAVLCVNSPGFPIARSLVASGKQQALILTGMVRGHADQIDDLIVRMGAVLEWVERRELMDEAARLAAFDS